MSEAEDTELLSVDYRKLRSFGSTIGQSFDKDALERLGLVDENGELVEDEIHARQEITEDGTVTINLEPPES